MGGEVQDDIWADTESGMGAISLTSFFSKWWSILRQTVSFLRAKTAFALVSLAPDTAPGTEVAHTAYGLLTTGCYSNDESK